MHRDKPPEAHTGGFGEPTCAACHLQDDPDAPPAGIRLLGLPAAFTSGQRYQLDVELTAKRLQVGGFQMAARFAEGPQRGRQAGRFVISGKAVAQSRVDSTGIDYVYHTAYSIAAKRDTLRWHVAWIAPAAAAAIDFHFAGNASNDDASNLGDVIVSGSARVRAR